MDAVRALEETVRALEKSATSLAEAALNLTFESTALDVTLEEGRRLNIAKGFDFYEAVRRFEVHLIERALRETSFHQAKAARMLGINKTTLNEKVRRYRLKRSSYRPDENKPG